MKSVFVRLFKRAAKFFMNWGQDNPYWSEEEIETPTGLLRFWDSFGGKVLELTLFLTVAFTMLRRTPCADEEWIPWLSCILPAALPSSLVLLIGTIYFLSRRSAAVELAIAQRLFPRGRVPEEWGRRRDPLWITVSIIAFFALYLALALLADRIHFVSVFMFCIACIDFNTRRLIDIRTEVYLDDPRYTPRSGDEDRRKIEKRRNVIRDYLYSKPHISKEAARACGCGLAAFIANAGYWRGIDWAEPLSYIVLVTTLLSNEMLTWKWRAERDHLLMAIEREET